MQQQKGFTLIELMMVVSIVSILVAIAIPQYQQYSVRSKLSEVLAQLDAAKTSVAEYYQSQGLMPSSGATAGINSDVGSKYLNSIVYTWVSNSVAVLSARVSHNVGGSIAENDTIDFEANGTPGRVDWDCKPGTLPTRYLPSDCRQ